ncbi:MAG: hypothetical protein JWP44_584 [Mucilaginibacter sp.]|nr:hypothetical protein [Mucilaginibacter sp.]
MNKNSSLSNLTPAIYVYDLTNKINPHKKLIWKLLHNLKILRSYRYKNYREFSDI